MKSLTGRPRNWLHKKFCLIVLWEADVTHEYFGYVIFLSQWGWKKKKKTPETNSLLISYSMWETRIQKIYNNFTQVHKSSIQNKLEKQTAAIQWCCQMWQWTATSVHSSSETHLVRLSGREQRKKKNSWLQSVWKCETRNWVTAWFLQNIHPNAQPALWWLFCFLNNDRIKN